MGKFIQFETSAVNLALSLREQIKRQTICITDDIPTPEGPLIVSRLRLLNAWVRRAPVAEKTIVSIREPFNADELYRYVDANRVQLVQAVEVSLSSVPQLVASGPAAPQTTQVLELHLIFNLRIADVDNDVWLSIGFEGIERLPPLASLQLLQQKIGALFPIQKIPLDVGKLSGLGGKPKVANVGIAAVASPGPLSANNEPLTLDSWILVRIELGAFPTTTAAWEAFYAANDDARFIAPGRGGFVADNRGWVLFTDQVFITDATRNSIEDNFKSSGKFKLQGGISASWSAPDNRAIVNLDFYGKAIDACDLGIFGNADIRLRVNVPIELSVIGSTLAFTYEPGALKQRVKVNYWKNDWDTARCVGAIVAFWPYFGPKLMLEDKLEWHELTITMVMWWMNPFLIAIPVLFEANKGGKAPSPGANCVRPDSKKDEFECTQPFDTSAIALGGLPRLRDYSGRPDGLVLLGDLFWTERLARRHLLTGIRIGSFKLGTPPYSCSFAGSLGLAWISAHPDWFAWYEAVIYLEYDLEPLAPNNGVQPISYSKTDIIQPYVCVARIRPEHDPLNVFAPYLTFDDGSVTLRVPVASVPDAYFADPYPCRVLIHTSDGVRIVTLSPIVKATDQELKSVTQNAWAKRVSDCYAKSKRYDPHWIIDPADLWLERHHWDVIVAGVRPGEGLSLADQRGRIVAAVRADRRGFAWLRAVLWPEAYDGQLSFRRAGPPMRMLRAGEQFDASNPAEIAVPEDYFAIDVKQTQLLLTGEIETAEPVLAAAPAMLGGRPGLLLLQRSGVAAYDLSRGREPRLVLRASSPDLVGLSGAFSIGDEIVVWGASGIAVLALDEEFGEVAVERLSRTPVDAMASVDRHVFILRRGRLEVWDRNRRREAVLEAPGARLLGVTSSHLLVGSGDGVTVYVMSDGSGLREGGRWRCEGLSRILASDLLTRDHEFLLQGARTELIDVSDPERITVVGEYGQAPELAAFVRDRDRLIELEPGATSVRLYAAGKTAVL